MFFRKLIIKMILLFLKRILKRCLWDRLQLLHFFNERLQNFYTEALKTHKLILGLTISGHNWKILRKLIMKIIL